MKMVSSIFCSKQSCEEVLFIQGIPQKNGSVKDQPLNKTPGEAEQSHKCCSPCVIPLMTHTLVRRSPLRADDEHVRDASAIVPRLDNVVAGKLFTVFFTTEHFICCRQLWHQLPVKTLRLVVDMLLDYLKWSVLRLLAIESVAACLGRREGEWHTCGAAA